MLLPAVAAILSAVVLGNVAAMGLSSEVAGWIIGLGLPSDAAHVLAYGALVIAVVAVAALALRLISGMDDDAPDD